MIAAIRISGLVGLNADVKESLHRLRLRRKYSLVLLENTESNMKLLKNLRNFIAYGPIDSETLKELIEKRAIPLTKETKVSPADIVKNIDKKSLPDLGIKPFFRLHPPRKGIDSKKHFGVTKKAVLADNGPAINDLIRRML